jgi:hypothetical protein
MMWLVVLLGKIKNLDIWLVKQPSRDSEKRRTGHFKLHIDQVD